MKLRGLLWAVDARWRVRLMGVVRRHARGGDGGGGPHLMLGCFERVLFPKVSRAARALAPELGAPADQGCCGALHAHNGELERGRELGRELGERLPGTIVTTAGGCAAHLAAVLGPERVKELSQWLVERWPEGAAGDGASPGRPKASEGGGTGATPDEPLGGSDLPDTGRSRGLPEPVAAARTDDPALAEPVQTGAGDAAADRLGSAGTGDAPDRLGSTGAGDAPPDRTPSAAASSSTASEGCGRTPGGRGRLRIGLQDSCHLRNGLGVHTQPRALIAEVGEYVELPGAAECCGAAGTYAILRPNDSARVLDAKLDQIAEADLDLVVAVNPGCLRQLDQGLRRRGLKARAVHVAELLVDSR